MTRAQLIAALRRGDASPDMQRLAADLLEPKKRGPKPKPDDVKLAEAQALIARVGGKEAELGSLEAAFSALATPKRTADSVRRKYYAARTLEIDNIFNEFVSER